MVLPLYLEEVSKYMPGHLFRREPRSIGELITKLFDALDLVPNHFFPDFSNPPKELPLSQDDNLGEVRTFRYEAKVVDPRTNTLRDIYWFIKVAQDGYAWVPEIRFADAELIKHGKYGEIINSGFITSKPLEYDSQIENLLSDRNYKHEAIYVTGDYYDIRRFFDRMPYMQDFYASSTYKQMFPRGPVSPKGRNQRKPGNNNGDTTTWRKMVDLAGAPFDAAGNVIQSAKSLFDPQFLQPSHQMAMAGGAHHLQLKMSERTRDIPRRTRTAKPLVIAKKSWLTRR